MFSKFKSVSLEGDLIKKTAEDFIIDKFIEYSKCFNDEHENDWIYLQLINYIKRMNI